jgi:glycosyltransferase involved in cell wall biosynthesis
MGDDLEIIVQDGDIEPDKGQSDALNKGFSKAKGEWLFWLNADDVLLEGALKSLAKRVKSLEFKDVEWVAGDTVYLDQGGIARDVRTDAKWHPWLGKKLSVWTGGPSSFFRRELWERYGGFNVDLKYVMDIDLWTRWAKRGVKFKSVGRYVWGFRVHEESKTTGGRNKKSHYEERTEVLKSHGLYKQQGWRNLTRMCSLLDGGWFKRLRDRKRFFGINWRDLTI